MKDLASRNRLLLGEAIGCQRRAQGITQETLAIMAGTSKSHIWRIETGRVGISVDLLSRISEALDIRARDLIVF